MMNMDFVCKLPIPKLIKEEFPMTAEAKAIKEQKDKERFSADKRKCRCR